MPNPKLAKVSSKALFGVLATLQCAHEQDALDTAMDIMARWRVTSTDIEAELEERNVIALPATDPAAQAAVAAS